ncbi:MAG: hypothetical protein BRC29_01140 [Nanohaloarchaea archaeon SW_7_43_1]|nr:MAG: hypothetical protein BRC29_01140 [Nanohaloarchaea archaeon SW_7_43_1]
MQDPWKFLGFPAAAVGGYLIASTQVAVFLKDSVGLSQFFSELAIVAVTGFIAGFLVDEVIPTYIEHVRGGGAGPGGDLGGGGMDDDFDFD